ncbi:hypothetical protein BV898_16003 [Hypsibius exemplaris]|uniref:Uncharacterized protein n=1 Tax=Hypsibius exemplaris TaxID=2072580 RepID=A0A9X6NDX7_HYPEX|nr:hypothetical protein BV898_16003 [Hypsibius exemplaris]
MAKSPGEGLLLQTTNGFGWEYLYLDDVCLDFIQAMKALPGEPKIADLGVSTGYSTVQILSETAALVTANDLSSDLLSVLTARISKDQRSRWLKPGGLVYVKAMSPYATIAKEKFRAIYEDRVKAGADWPGEMDSETACWNRTGITAEHGYLFDLTVLERESRAVGLEILQLCYLPNAKLSSEKAHACLLAVKTK